MFPNLKDKLLPPTDRALAALLDDLHESGLLESTLIVMAGEFGRTPSISTLPGVKLPGRDPWGAVQTVFFAGGGIRGGTVIGLLRQERGVSRIQPANPRKHGCDYVPRPRYPQDCVLAGSIRPTALCLPRRASRWLGLAGQDHLSARPKVIFASRSSSHLMSRGQLLGFRLNEQRNVHERLYLDRRFLIDECDGGSCSR
jgi:hypothetical protein